MTTNSCFSAEAHTYSFTEPIDARSIATCRNIIDGWLETEPDREVQVVLGQPGCGITDALALVDYLKGLRRCGHMVSVLVEGGTNRAPQAESPVYSVFYTFPQPENGAADLVMRINSATSELARYGLSGHVLWFRRSGHGFAVLSREKDFLSTLPNPLHAVFSRGAVEEYRQEED